MQLLGGDRLEVPFLEVPRHLLKSLDAFADLLGGLVVRGLAAMEALAALVQEVLELPETIELIEQVTEVLAGLHVLEVVVAHPLDAI